jgi:hypothetical protein
VLGKTSVRQVGYRQPHLGGAAHRDESVLLLDLPLGARAR